MKASLKLLLHALATLAAAASLRAQGTAFTYQGRLNQNGAPVTGIYDLRFTIYDSLAGPGVVAGPLAQSAVGVTNGVFNATLDPGAGVFTGPARWLEIGVRPNGGASYTNLSPRQALLPTPYAIHAGTASNVANGSVVRSLNNLRDNVTLAAGANVTLTPSGNTLTIAAPGGVVGGPWSLNGANTYYNGGNVGIGSTTPNHQLRISGRLPWTSYYWGGALELDNASAIGWHANAAGNRFGIGQSTGGLYFFSTLSDPGTTGSPANYLMTINDTGNVGIGTSTPVSALEIVGQNALTITGYQPVQTFRDSSAGNARTAIQSVSGGMNLFTESYLSGVNGFAYLRLDNSGNVGIGSAAPVGKLEVVAQDALRLIGYQPFLTLLDVNAGYARSRIQGVNGDIVLEPESYINGSNPNAAVVIANSGNVSVRTLTIRGGADLAEPFELSTTGIAKGSVVIIDENQPGKLKLSTGAYDTRVAGIVSGANGVNPGISLQQDGVLEGGQNVALSGRVYVQADALHGAIKSGDLLTTSDTPGHAMKVGDHAKAQGAVLGKAMTGLKEGKGMVLVLVTLQ